MSGLGAVTIEFGAAILAWSITQSLHQEITARTTHGLPKALRTSLGGIA